MKIRPQLLYAVLALILAFGGLSPPPVWAAPGPQPWVPPSADILVPFLQPGGNPKAPDPAVFGEPWTYDAEQVSVDDFDIPEWMLSEDYLDGLPSHDIYKRKRNRQSDKFEVAYRQYEQEMRRRGQVDLLVDRDTFWRSFFPGGWNHLLTNWRNYVARNGPKTFPEYRAVAIEAFNINPRGSGFEKMNRTRRGVDLAHGFTLNNRQIPGVLPPATTASGKPRLNKKGNPKGYRIDDFRPGSGTEKGLILEQKARGTIDREQLNTILRHAMLERNVNLGFLFGEVPDAAELRYLARRSTELLAERIAAYPRTGQSTIRGGGVIQAWMSPAAVNPLKPAATGSLAPGPKAAASLTPKATASIPKSPADAADTRRIKKELQEELEEPPEEPLAPPRCPLGRSPCKPATASDLAAAEYDGDDLGDEPRTLGGVDFSTLELRYVSDTYDGGLGAGLRYAYQVDPKPGTPVSYGGKESAQLAADAFFTWLALPPASFTVNLNPDEPNRIMDAKLGRTEAGRTLLDADFQMKKTVAKLIHPDSATGKEFWPELQGKAPCISMRQWIVPRPAVVREQGNELFILDAPLEVKMETEYLKTKGKGSEGCPGHSTAETGHNEGVYRVVVLPELQKQVNEAPEYADLRRVYASRVAAEWYRERSATKRTAYGDLIDSGDASAWPLREKWTPKDTWKRFVKSYKDGEFRVERTSEEGTMLVTRLYVYGGVDFSNIPERRLSSADFTAKRPAMGAAANASTALPVAEAGGPLWLGGWSTERPESARIPAPEPPLGRPVFWAATTAPVLAWMIVAGVLLARRRRMAR